MANLVKTLLMSSRRAHAGVRGRVGDFELDDIGARARLLQLAIQTGIQGPQANTDSQRSFTPECFDERQHNLADHNRIFARLDIKVGDAWRTMMNEQFGELVVPGAVAGQGPV